MSLSLAERPATPVRPLVTEAELNYLGPVEGRPFTYTFAPPPGRPRSNITAKAHRVPIQDLRPMAGTVSLDREGFAVAHGASALRDFDNEAAIRAVYYPESARILQAATGAAGSTSSTTRSADVSPAPRTAARHRDSPWHACTSTTPSAPGRSASATSCRGRRNACCAAACRS